MAKRIDVLPRREFDVDDRSYSELDRLVHSRRDLSLGRSPDQVPEQGLDREIGNER